MNKKICSMHINRSQEHKTIKDILKGELKLSNRIISNLKYLGKIFVNGEKQNVNFILEEGDIIELFIEEGFSENILPQKMELEIIYEDEDILIINKPPNVVMHPTTYNFTNTLANGVMYYYESKGIRGKFRPVNRLDKDTSGLVLIAKSQLSHSILSNEIINGEFKKEYIAVVHNPLDIKHDIIDFPIERKEDSIIERVVHPNGKKAVTEYSVICQNNNASVVRINLLTGRTHQIRVHFSYLGHPLYGDELYGAKDELINRQALHCVYLNFFHPIKKEQVSFTSEIPKDIKNLIEKLNMDYL